jgi:hypothetical protein
MAQRWSTRPLRLTAQFNVTARRRSDGENAITVIIFRNPRET